MQQAFIHLFVLASLVSLSVAIIIICLNIQLVPSNYNNLLGFLSFCKLFVAVCMLETKFLQKLSKIARNILDYLIEY